MMTGRIDHGQDFEQPLQFSGMVEADGVVVEIDAGLLTMCGARRDDVVSRPLWEAPAWAGNQVEQQRLHQAVERAAGGELVRYEVELPSRGSRLGTVTFDFSLSPVLDAAGRTGRLIFVAREIAGNERAETDLQATLNRYQAVLASALDPVITIDGYGIIQSASRSVERVFGYEPSEIEGLNISMLMPEPHRSMHDKYLNNYRRTGETNILGRTREFEAVRKDGQKIPIELSVSRVVVPGQPLLLFTAIIHDISDRKRAEREISLLQSLTLAIGESNSVEEAFELTLRTICEAAGWAYGEAWLLADAASEALEPALMWSRPGCTFEGLEHAARELTFKHGRGLPGQVWQRRKTMCFEDLAHLPPDIFTRRDIALASGITAVVGVPILTDEQMVAVLLFFLQEKHEVPSQLLHLVTAAAAPLGNAIRRRQAENELERHRRDLELLVDERTGQLEKTHEQLRLADRLAAIGTLAAGLGHDMNNVLLPVRCRLDALDSVELSSDVREQFQAVRWSVMYLQQLSDGLHLLALDPDDVDASEGSTDLKEWWGQIGSLMRKALPRLVSFEIDLPPELPPIAVAPHRLTQAILNLVVNAGEAVEERGRVVMSASMSAEGEVQISIQDDGCGMTGEVKRRALDPFFTTKKRGLGTGLGLSLVRGVVQSAGGSMAIDSSPGVGTTVSFSIPAASEPTSKCEGEDPLCAFVVLGEARRASFVTALLTAAGIRAERNPAQSMECDLWVVDHSEELLAAARRYRQGTNRPVVVFGSMSLQSNDPGLLVVEAADDFERIRQAISEAVAAAAGDT